MAKTQNTDTECQRDAEQQALSLVAGGNAVEQPPWTAERFLAKQTRLLPFSPAVVLLPICPKELKTYFHTKT